MIQFIRCMTSERQICNFLVNCVREGFKKSKWKFKMVFSMKGGGVTSNITKKTLSTVKSRLRWKYFLSISSEGEAGRLNSKQSPRNININIEVWKINQENIMIKNHFGTQLSLSFSLGFNYNTFTVLFWNWMQGHILVGWLKDVSTEHFSSSSL